jgi:pimeloyl-ACP methyl ester carboxylesterase
MRLMNTLRTLRGKETRLRIMPLGCPPGMWCSTARRLTRGVLGWDTLGGPDRRAGDDHPAGPGGHGHRDIMAPIINSYIPARHIPDAQLITYPDSGHGVLVQYPACSRPTSPASPGTDAAFA